MNRSLLLTFGAVMIALGACGRMAPLQPAEGQALPVKPLMAQSRPDAEDLLTRPPYANPNRVDELIRRSQPREIDRFDLPPPTGEALPAPAGAQTDSQEEDEGPVTPDA